MSWAASMAHSSARSAANEVTPLAAAPLMNSSATGPRAQKACSASVLGRTARAG